MITTLETDRHNNNLRQDHFVSFIHSFIHSYIQNPFTTSGVSFLMCATCH